MPSLPLVSRRAVLALLIGLTAYLAACGSSGGGGTPTPVPTVPEPALVSVPAGTVIDLDRAAELYHERDYEGALVIYSAAAKNGTAAQKQAGLMATARIQNETGKHSEAARTIRAFRATANPSAEQDRQALLLLGSSLFAQGDFGPAGAALEQYVTLGGPASPHAQLYLAQIDSRDGELDSAVDRINEAFNSGLSAETLYQAQLLLAGIQVQRENTEEAIAAYRAAADRAPTATKAAEALWLLAEAAGDDEIATGALATLIANYPITDRALEALDDPRVVNNPELSAVQRATVYLNQHENKDATTAFQAIVNNSADPAEIALAQYDLGILSERAEEWQGAIDHYDAAIAALAPGENDSLRAQASWDKGTVLELLGLTSDAIAAYAAVSDNSASAERAPEGLFRAGYLSYITGQTNDSIVYWNRYLGAARAAEDVARADYWLAEASAANGDPDSAAAYLAAAAGDDQLDYYGMRAAARLAEETAFPDSSNLTPPAPDWTRYEAWLSGWAGPEDVVANDALFAGDWWLGAVDLYEAGLTESADAQFSALLEENAGDAWLVYRLVRAINEYHRPWITSPAASGLLGEPDAPPEALQLMYPLEYWALVQKEAGANGFSPLLLLALIRQESLYDPGVVSSANALGLTQVVPSTAEGIAQELGVDDFKESDLLTAKTSLQFGAYYLGASLRGFGGVLPPTVAGYNAGPGTSRGWWEDAGLDPDIFLESVPYAETRLFVEVVQENYARYLYAYGVTDTPALPLP
jgi:soluble lytic murein transglycosylase